MTQFECIIYGCEYEARTEEKLGVHMVREHQDAEAIEQSVMRDILGELANKSEEYYVIGDSLPSSPDADYATGRGRGISDVVCRFEERLEVLATDANGETPSKDC